MINQRNKYLFKNTIIFAIGNFGTKLISFFLVPLYTNILSKSEFGITDLIFTIGTITVPILTLNIVESVMRFSMDKDADYNKIMSIGLVIMGAFSIIGLMVIPLAKLYAEISQYSGLLYLYIISFGLSQILLSYLRGRELLLQYSIGNIIQSLITAVLNIVLLMGFHQGIKGYLTAYIIAHFVSAIYAFIMGNVTDIFKHFKIDCKLSSEMIKYSLIMLPNAFMWWIMNSSDRVMVTGIINSAANGIYAVSYKMPTMLSTVVTIFNQAWAYSAIREEDSEDKEEYHNDIYTRLFSIVIIAAIGLMMVMKPFLKLYVGKEYYEAWKYTPYLIIAFVFMTLGNFIATAYIVHKDSKGYLVSGIVGAVINIILNWIMIPRIGITGAALATCISYILVYLFRIIHTRKYIKIDFLKKRDIIGFMLLIISGGTLYIDSPIGQLILIIEFALVTLVFKEIFVGLFKTINGMMKKKFGKA